MYAVFIQTYRSLFKIKTILLYLLAGILGYIAVFTVASNRDTTVGGSFLMLTDAYKCGFVTQDSFGRQVYCP